MICTHCSTEIADKALICYRCGRATAEPRIKPPASGRLLDARPRRRPRMRNIVFALVLLAIGLWLLVEQPWENSQISSPQYETGQLSVGGARDADPSESRSHSPSEWSLTPTPISAICQSCAARPATAQGVSLTQSMSSGRYSEGVSIAGVQRFVSLALAVDPVQGKRSIDAESPEPVWAPLMSWTGDATIRAVLEIARPAAPVTVRRTSAAVDEPAASSGTVHLTASPSSPMAPAPSITKALRNSSSEGTG